MTQKKKSKAKLTVQEFQTWLEGIMEFQDSDWSPNKEQWIAIYDKIMNLKVETGNTVNLSANSMKEIVDNINSLRGDLENFRRASPQYAPPTIMEERDPRSLAGGSGEAQIIPQAPVEQEIISQEELNTLTREEIQQKIEEAKKYGSSSGSTTNPIKPRDIDTSDGNYKSDFI